MLVSQGKQEVVAYDLYSFEESKRQRENSLTRSANCRESEWGQWKRDVKVEEQREATRPIGWETLNLSVRLAVLEEDACSVLCCVVETACSNESPLLWFNYATL